MIYRAGASASQGNQGSGRPAATPVLRDATNVSLVDVLDHVLDKGIVVDAWVRVSVIGIDLITVEARVVVASIETYLQHADAVAQVNLGAPPRQAIGPVREP